MTSTTTENNTSLKNVGEAKLVEEAYTRLLKQAKCRHSDIGIITPYRAQQEEIRDCLLSRFGPPSRDTAVGTVHALQGAERDYIIISFVRSTAEDFAIQEAVDSSAATDIVVSVHAGNP